MGLTDAVKALYKNYAKFDGRASRSEYWWAFLYFFGIYATFLIGASVEAGALGTMLTLILSLVILGTFIPMIAVAVRRLHDYDKSGWLYLVGLIPFVSLYILYLYVQPGTRGPNRFGPDPLDRDAKRELSPRQYTTRPIPMGTPVEGSHTRIFM